MNEASVRYSRGIVSSALYKWGMEVQRGKAAVGISREELDLVHPSHSHKFRQTSPAPQLDPMSYSLKTTF